MNSAICGVFYVLSMKKNIPTISLIIAFSILLWIFVSFEGDFSLSLKLPIRLIDIPENHSVSEISSNDVSISLKGKGWVLAQHTLGRDPKFNIPSPYESGVNEISTRNVLFANSWLSSALQLTEINPEKITIKIEETISKKVEIVPVISLNYKAGYGLVSPVTIEPDSVVVTGPKSIIDNINIVNTKTKMLSNIEDESSVILGLEGPQYVSMDVKDCKVSFDVQKIVDKVFEELEIDTKNIPSRYELIVSPNKLSIILRGGINLLSKLENKDINVFVNFEQAINDTNGAIEPNIVIPEFTSLIDIKPNRLDYIIKKY